MWLIHQSSLQTTTIFLHRGLTHRSLNFSRITSLVMRFVNWLTTGIIPRQWVAVHRKHHAHTDVEGDPHSPKLLGGDWKVTFRNVVYYRAEANNPQTVATYAKDIEKDWLDTLFFDHSLLGIAIGVGLCVWAFGWLVGGLGYAVHGYLYILKNGAVNGIGHSERYGYRNFDNTASNHRALAVTTAGEGLHNNHHGHQRSPKLSMAPGEFDPAWPVIKTLSWVRLLKILGKPVKIPARGRFTGTPA